MVTDADAVISIANDQGMLAALAPGAIWAQMSTIGLAGIDRVAAVAGAERADVMLLDAPVADALGGSPLMSTWQAAKLQRIANGEFSAQFALSLALKDVHLVLQAAGGDRFAALGCLAGEWQQAVDRGLGGQDATELLLALRGRWFEGGLLYRSPMG